MNFFFRFLNGVLFLILIYVVYRSEIYWSGSRRFDYSIYFIVTLLSIVFFTISINFKSKIKEYIIIIFLTTIFSFYLYEGIFFLNEKKIDVSFDTRTKFQVYKDLKKTNKDVTVTISANFFLSDNDSDLLTLAGIAKAQTIFCNENGYYSIYQSDRHGFNNPDKEWDSEEIEYLLVGDSYVHGACVNVDNDVSSFLRKFSQKKVLNLGQSGNGPLVNYATLREYLMPKTKNILWVYSEVNDLQDLKKELKNKILKKYLDDKNFEQGLKNKQDQIDQMLRVSIDNEQKKIDEYELRNDNKIVKFIKLFHIRNLIFNSLSLQPSAPSSDIKLLLMLTNELVERYNGKLSFVYLPDISRYNGSFFPPKNDRKEEIKKIVKDLSIEFIDIDEEVFKKEKDVKKLFPLTEFGHYNIEGYKKVALKIYERTK